MPRNARNGSSQRGELDSTTFIFGSLLGLALGAVMTLWYAPRTGAALRKQIASEVTQTADAARSQVAALTADPLAESLAEGKAAARQRRASLGL